ncbi:MAG: hypothetical protein KC620_19220, partial [Myxococcales bacterium]|nr:hypothetical protein [Myxococcales bacterium]
DVVISNRRPTLSLEFDSPQNEGAEVVVRAVAEDPGLDELTYTFDFDGDGIPEIADSADPIGRHDYPDLGLFTIEVTVDDGTDRTSTSEVIDIRNVAPLVRLTTNSPVDEGDELILTAEVSDPGDDTITVRFDVDGDRVADTELVAEAERVEQRLIAQDNNRFNVTVWAADEDGGESEQTVAVIVRNVPPSFPDEFIMRPAVEGEVYLGTVPAIDPAGPNDRLRFTLRDPPGHINIDEFSGQILWTPTYNDYLDSPVQLTVQVDDGDGGRAETDIFIEVIARDLDNDQLPDSYEELTCNDEGVCLDPTNPNDAREDPDHDGRDNLTEWMEDTDPFTYEGPGAPVLMQPPDGSRIGTLTPGLVVSAVENAAEAAVTIEFEIYADADLMVLVGASGPVEQAEDEATPTSWSPPEGLLFEDQWYWWRARSISGEATSDWTAPWRFRTNSINEAPSAPVPIAPPDQAIVAERTPTFRVQTSTDVDEDELRYIFRLYGPITVNGTGRVMGDEVEFVPDQQLPENAVIEWDVVAVDEAGAMSDASPRWRLRIDSENSAPSAPEVLDPMKERPNDVPLVASLTPTFVAGNSQDPDGDALFYVFAVRPKEGGEAITSEDIPEVDGAASWTVPQALVENGVYSLDVFARDARGTVSETTTIDVFISAEDEPPPVPTLLSPVDGARIAAGDAILLWEKVADPENMEPVNYIVEVCPSGGECFQSNPQPQSAWNLTERVTPGTNYSWTVEAIDPSGNRSGKSGAWVFQIERQASSVSGCGCDLTERPAPPWAIALLLVGLVGLSRRRRR